jgi:hypothetical protein
MENADKLTVIKRQQFSGLAAKVFDLNQEKSLFEISLLPQAKYKKSDGEIKLITGNELAKIQIGEALILIVQMIGIDKNKNLTTDYLKMISNVILEYYGEFCPEELTKAFELACMGRLNVDIKHYNAFDLPYIKRVFEAYKQFKTKLIERQLFKVTQREKDFVGEAIEALKENDRSVKGSIVVLYESFLNGKLKNWAINYIRADYYDCLEDIGAIRLNEAEKAAIIRETEKKFLENSKSIKEKSKLIEIKRQMVLAVFGFWSKKGYTPELIAKHLTNKVCFLGPDGLRDLAAAIRKNEVNNGTIKRNGD